MTKEKTAPGFLDQVYKITAAEEVAGFYDNWSAHYDAEVAENGYVTPARCAAALAACTPDMSQPLLDIGCGTGLSGMALRSEGFSVIDGTDFSAAMLDRARARPRVYRNLTQTDLDNPLPFEDGAYPLIAAIGLFSPAHAPPGTIDDILRKLPRRGLFVFSLNDHALADPGYEARILDWTDCGAAFVQHREHGPHLPKIGLEATVYVLQKA